MELITRQLCLAHHVGTKEILFGGQMLAWADIAASLWCMRIARSDNMITVHMSDVNFVTPVRVGDIVEFYGEWFQTGKTSVTVKIVVMIHDPRTGQTTEAFRYTTVMVNIDRNLRPKPLPPELQNLSQQV
ncbi:MAG: acyl-CoA thioesterase [bacterium]